MLIETDNLVSADVFRHDFDKYVESARAGNGPVAVMRGAEIVGVLISPADYESLFGVAVRDLLTSRSSGPTVSHQQAKTRIRRVLAKSAKPT